MNKNNLKIIAAVGNRWELGLKNRLLCHLPEDMKYFKETTRGHTVIMGDRTWESLPVKPLPHRRNIVLSLNPDFECQGAKLSGSLPKTFDLLAPDETAFVIGGATIYRLFLPYVGHLYLTRVLANFEADVFFPEIDLSRWTLVEDTFFEKDEKNLYNLRFQHYQLNQ
ncbi:MAG: dihydrofolate reductase [Bacteroidales bacterium]|jgi:dihydrofolate reductase|nr:dihydrofolate reductase [Bacteroidales bacterium]